MRAGAVNFGGPKKAIFAEPLRVQPVEKAGGPRPDDAPPRIGEVEFRNGRLVGGSVRATGRLPYFDDATGTLGLVVSEDPQTEQLDCLGTFDVKGSEKFDLAALYSRCEVQALHLETRYKAGGWTSKGEITGCIKFGPDPSGMGALARLFDGVTVEFEDLDLRGWQPARRRSGSPARRNRFRSPRSCGSICAGWR